MPNPVGGPFGPRWIPKKMAARAQTSGIQVRFLRERTIHQTDAITIISTAFSLDGSPLRVITAIMDPAQVSMHPRFDMDYEARLHGVGFYRPEIDTIGKAFQLIPDFFQTFFGSVPTVDKFTENFRRENPSRKVIAVTNASNCPTHDFELTAVLKDGELKVFTKDKYRSVRGRTYSCFVQRRDGSKLVVPLRFNDDYTQVVEGPTDIDYAMYGQQVVRNGRPAELDRFLPEYTTELRHIIDLPAIQIGKSVQYIGMQTLINRINSGERAKLANRLSNNDWVEFHRQEEAEHLGIALTNQQLRKAFKDSGYSESDYEISGNKIRIKLKFNRYRHLILGTLQDGRIFTSIFLDAGFNFPEIANILVSKGVKDAIILGNGKDVRLLAEENNFHNPKAELNFQEPDARSNIGGGIIVWSANPKG